MKRFFLYSVTMLVLMSVSSMNSYSQVNKKEVTNLKMVPQLYQTPDEKNQRMEWFRDAKFGMFIHWGPCTVGKKEIGWGRNANRPWDINPSLHGNGFRSNDSVYDNYYKEFNPVNYKPTQWVKMAKNAGMKYIVLITKHHDGFSMFDSKYTDYDIMASPFKKDIIKDFVDACHKENMKVGLYYSTRDWYHPDYLKVDNNKYDQFYRSQIKELLSNYGKIDIMWFDHVGGRDWTKWRMDSLFTMMYQLQPHLLVNNRAAAFIGSGMAAKPSTDPVLPEIKTMTKGDYYTPEGKIGAMDIKRDWESCIHIGEGWSNRGENSFTPIESCITMLVSCLTGGGNLLLNFDPNSLGDFPKQETLIAKKMGEFTLKYKKAIYGTRAGPFANGIWGGSTHKDNKIFLFVKSRDNITIDLPVLPIKVKKVRMLNNSKTLLFTQDNKKLTITLDENLKEDLYTVLELTVTEKVSDQLMLGSLRCIFDDEVIYGRKIDNNTFISLSSKEKAFNNDKYNNAFLSNVPISSDYSFSTDPEKNPWILIDLKTTKNITGVHLVNKPNQKLNADFIVNISADSVNWETVYKGKLNKDFWDIPISQLKTGAEVPGKALRFIIIKAFFEADTSFKMRKAEIFSK